MTDRAITSDELKSDKPARDSIFGVCAALAADFGFNPQIGRASCRERVLLGV